VSNHKTILSNKSYSSSPEEFSYIAEEFEEKD